jgi:hypothetical protein
VATTRLKIYNGALLICGARSIASLTVNEEARHLLDVVWNDGGTRFCLEQGQWHFAMRAVRIDYDPDVDPEFGYQRAFAKPTDWVATSALCSDERFMSPLLQFIDEAGYWYADHEEIYLKYVSDDAAFGGDLALWPYSFTEFVKAHFAAKIIRKLPGGTEKVADVLMQEKRSLLTAKNKDAMAGPATFSPPGSWSLSRGGGRTGRERGNRGGNLTE